MSYAPILRELNKCVNPDELDATVQGIRETRSKDLLVELKCSTKNRERFNTAFNEVVGARGTVRHLIPRIEVEIANLEPTIEAEDVEDAVRSYFDQGPELELRVSLSKTAYRGNRKTYVVLEEARALKLLKGAHIKIGWVSCRVCRRKEVNRCFRCLGFGHIAADCRGPDRSRCCWKCDEEGHLAGSCTGSPGASTVPQGRKSPGMTTYRGLCIARLFGRQPRIESLRKAAMERRTEEVSPATKMKKQGGQANIALRWPPL